MTVATPDGYKPAKEIFNYAVDQGKASGSTITWTKDPKTAVKDADVIVTDTFVSMGQEEETKKRLEDFKGFQVNTELTSQAKENYKFMHCLPRHEHEVSDEVFYSKHSIVFDEAENRLHTIMAVLDAVMTKATRS